MKSNISLILIIVFFISLGIIYSYPLISNFSTSIPYAYGQAPVYSEVHLVPGDHLLLYYTYWLLKNYFESANQNLLTEPYMFYIKNWPRPYEPRGLPSSMLFLISSFCGNAIGYNSVILLSFLLSGLFAFLLAKKYLNNTTAALVSGTIFAISPFRLTQLFGGHPTGFILFWIPLIIYLYELLWEKKKLIYGYLAGLFIFFMCMEEHHMGYYTALFTIAFWFYKYFIPSKKKKLTFPELIWLSIPVFIGWFMAFSYMIYIKLTVIGSSIAARGREFSEIKLFSPYIKHIFQRINPDSEKYIYIGIIAGILILFTLYKRITQIIKDAFKKDNFPFLFYFLTFFVTLLLSIGPNLKYFPIYKVCYKLIPFFKFPRATSRIFMYTLLSLSLLSGYGIKVLLQYFKRKWTAYLVSVSILLLVCLDFRPFPKIKLCRLDKGNKTYEVAKKSSPDNPLLEIPLWPGESSWSSIYQYYTTIYKIPLINGYSPFVTQRYLDSIFWSLVSINMGMINNEQYELLKRLNIKYINLHEEAYPPKVSPFPFRIALENLKQSPFVKFIISDGPMYLFNVLDSPGGNSFKKYTIPSKTGVFYECENMPRRIGKIIDDKTASGNNAILADENVSEPVHFIFGPWQLFPPGKYKILFRVKPSGKNSNDKIATLEVTTDNGNIRIISKDLCGPNSQDKYTDHILNFTLDKLTPLEFRIIYYGFGSISADYIYLLCEEENDPVWHYQAKDLFHIGREKDGAVYADPKQDPQGMLVFGPYRRYPPGKYKAGFKLKAGKKINSQSAILKVSVGHNDKPLAAQPLQDIDTEYKTYYLTVSLDKPTVLEFQVEFLKAVPLHVDSIEIELVSWRYIE